MLANDGVIIYLSDKEPGNQWWIAGGPAIKVDYEPTLSPNWVSETLEKNGFAGKEIGIFRIVSKEKLADKVWAGILPEVTTETRMDDGTTIDVTEIECNLQQAIARLTFGALGDILDVHLDKNIEQFWHPHIITNMGFFNAELTGRRFFNYIDILRLGIHEP